MTDSLISQVEAYGEGAIPFLKWLSTAGGMAVGGFCVWLVYAGKLVLKRELDQREKLLAEAIDDRDEWKKLALTLLSSTQRSVTATEKATGIAEQAAGVVTQIASGKQ